MQKASTQAVDVICMKECVTWMADPSQQAEGETGTAESETLLRWPLILAVLAIFVLCLIEPNLLIAGTAAVLIVLIAAVLATNQRRRARTTRNAEREDEPVAVPAISPFDLADAVADPLVVFDRAGVVVHANAAVAPAFGPLAAGAMVQLRFRAPEVQNLIEKAMEGQSAPAVDYTERLPMERSYRVSVGPLGERSDLAVLVFRDQSETRRIDRMRADFIANASHELRTPLASISGFIETIRGPAREDAVARERFLGIMQEQTGRMARLIDDLLSLSRVEMKASIGPTQRADLRKVLDQVVETSAHRAADLGVTLNTDFADGDFFVAGDRDELFQVFENLVENACKYGRSGGRVDIALKRGMDAGEAGIAVSVRDHGAGIAEEHIPRITERFYRIEAESGRSQKGTGLGLAIVKHIVTRHHARLVIRSRVGEGSEFTVFFPVRVS